MGVNKHLIWILAAFFGVVFVFSAFYPQGIGNIAQAYDEPVVGEGFAKPGVDTESKVQPADPIGFLITEDGVLEGDLEITIYEQDLALVKELREIELDSGVNVVEYSNIASMIEPASVMVEDPENEETAVIEQNYEYDLVSSFSLLEKYLDQEITVTGGDGEIYTGELLGYEEGSVILRGEDGNVMVLQDILKVEVSDASGLSTEPTLIWELYSPVSGTRELLISYLTSGMNWGANYALISNADDTLADVRSWVNIENMAGTDFENATMKLVSGEINVVSPPQPVFETVEDEAVAEEAAIERPFTQESLFEYHLYTLEEPVTLRNNQEKQISLFREDSVPIERELIFDSTMSDRVRAFLTLQNTEENGLGMPLPAGTVRVYKADTAGQLQFLGEDSIDHTPEEGEIRVAVGTSFDVTATKTETEFERVSENVERVSYEIELTNRKSEAEEVTVVEHFFGQWEILESSHEYEQIDAFTVEFNVTVPANGTEMINYTVERRF